jgi:hypothetical protein
MPARWHKSGRSRRVHVAVARGDFFAVRAKEVTLILDHPAAGVEPIRRTATLRDGIWQSTGCRCR